VISQQHWRWVTLNALIGTAITNLVVNFGIGLFSARGIHHVPTWSISAVHPGVTSDLLGILFTLPLITCVLVSLGIRRELADGKLAQLDAAVFGRWAMLTIASTGKRALRFGIATIVLAGPPLLIATAIAARHGMSHNEFVTFHVAMTVTLGLLVTPLIALAAMTVAPAPAALAVIETAE
jgi:hypothetical protein